MRYLSITLLFCVGFATSAFADGKVFPPDNCTPASPFMAWTGADGSNTYCNSGQGILSNALSGCGSGQQVAYNGTNFFCKDGPSNCAPGEFLTFTNGAYGCASTDVPTCGADQVLTFNGSAFICVAKSGSIPTCAANEFLTYNGTTFQCAATQTLTIPSCGSGEVLTGSGGSLTCVAQTSGGPAGSWCGLATANIGFVQYVTPNCSSLSAYTSVATCNGSSVTSSCPSGYTLKSAMTGYTDWGAASGGGGSGYSYSCIRTCAKN